MIGVYCQIHKERDNPALVMCCRVAVMCLVLTRDVDRGQVVVKHENGSHGRRAEAAKHLEGCSP